MPAIILSAGFLISAGFFVFQSPDSTAQDISFAAPQWAEKTGEGTIVPACASAPASMTCNLDGTASVAFNSNNTSFHTAHPSYPQVTDCASYQYFLTGPTNSNVNVKIDGSIDNLVSCGGTIALNFPPNETHSYWVEMAYGGTNYLDQGNFTTPDCAPPPPPIPSDPSGLNASCPVPGTSLSFSWNLVSGATYYKVSLADLATWNSGACGIEQVNCLVYSGPNTSYSQASTPGVEYHMNVRACNSSGCSGAPDAGVTCELAPQCSNGIDDDGDGTVDFGGANPDPGCSGPNDNDERNQCSNGIDDDGDTLVDTNDPGCHTDGNPGNPGSYDPNDNDETNAPAQPDLIVQSQSVSPGSPTAGQQVTFSGIIGNQGAGSAPATQTRLRIDIGANNWTFGEPESLVPTGALAGGGSETEIWTNFWTAVAGTHNYELCADNTNLVSESDDGNNCVSGTFTVGAAVACSDGLDNDGDGKVDFGGANPDPGCSGPNDNDERNQCSNGIDDDGDTLVDTNDPGCHTDGNPGNPGSYDPNDNDETNAPAGQCTTPTPYDPPAPVCAPPGGTGSITWQWTPVAGANQYEVDILNSSGSVVVDNGWQNDTVFNCGSGTCRYTTSHVAGSYRSRVRAQGVCTPSPFGVSNLSTITVCATQCNDGLDNDNDGRIDTNDPSCHTDGNPGNPGSYNPNDNDESSPPQCSDGFDNDGDGNTDYPNDLGCSSASDNSEDAPQCSDSGDNDGDLLNNYPNDPGCSSAADNDERNICADGIDNDNDGKVDFSVATWGGPGQWPGKDPGCSSASDNTEADPPTFIEVPPE